MDIEDIYGNEWGKKYKKASVNTISEEEIKDIADIVIKKKGFDDPKDLKIEYEGRNSSYDVILLEARDASIEEYKDKYIYKLKYGYSISFFTTIDGQRTIFSCLLNEDLAKEALKGFKPGTFYVGIGRYDIDENEEKGDVYHQLRPCMELKSIDELASIAGVEVEDDEDDDDFEEIEDLDDSEEESEEKDDNDELEGLEEVDDEEDEEDDSEEEEDLVDQMFNE